VFAIPMAWFERACDLPCIFVYIREGPKKATRGG
jgi:hypothetical protein